MPSTVSIRFRALLATASIVLAAVSAGAQSAAIVSVPPSTRAPDATPLPGGADARAGYAGTFRYAGSSQQQARIIEQAIDRSVESLFFAVRPVARRRLREANPFLPSVTLQFDDGHIVVRMRDRTWRSPADGAPVTVRDAESGPFRVRSRFERGRVSQSLSSEEGEKRTDFTLSPDGRTLTVRVTISASQLPQPVRYDLVFRR